MPPLRDLDRNLTPDTVAAMMASGHEQQWVVIDPSFPLPKEAEVFDYRGNSSADALFGLLTQMPVEHNAAVVMDPDPLDVRPNRLAAKESFRATIDRLLARNVEIRLAGVCRKNQDAVNDYGFYRIANESYRRSYYLRTSDQLPYACAMFVVGHAQNS